MTNIGVILEGSSFVKVRANWFGLSEWCFTA